MERRDNVNRKGLEHWLDNIEHQSILREVYPDNQDIKEVSTNSILIARQLIIKNFELLEKQAKQKG